MKTQEELRAAHGTPDEFAFAVSHACNDLFCTIAEANTAIAKYRAEYEAAPLTAPSGPAASGDR